MNRKFATRNHTKLVACFIIADCFNELILAISCHSDRVDCLEAVFCFVICVSNVKVDWYNMDTYISDAELDTAYIKW
jgi:hypothetical protein